MRISTENFKEVDIKLTANMIEILAVKAKRSTKFTKYTYFFARIVKRYFARDLLSK